MSSSACASNPAEKITSCGPETLERRNPVPRHGVAELLRACARGERHVHHIRRRIFGPAVRIERVLERRDHQHALLVREDVLGAVAVVHVEIHDDDALDAVRMHRVARRDRDVVEDAKAHRSRAAGMVPGRTHVAVRARHFAFHHQVGRKHRGARSAQRSRQGVRIHRRIRIEMNRSALRRGVADRAHILDRMHARKLFVARERRFVPDEKLLDARSDELVLDCAEALRAFRVAAPHVVLEAIRVRDESGRHGLAIIADASTAHWQRGAT